MYFFLQANYPAKHQKPKQSEPTEPEEALLTSSQTELQSTATSKDKRYSARNAQKSTFHNKPDGTPSVENVVKEQRKNSRPPQRTSNCSGNSNPDPNVAGPSRIDNTAPQQVNLWTCLCVAFRFCKMLQGKSTFILDVFFVIY